MNSLFQHSSDDRRIYFEEAAARISLPSHSIEKDFWVCWTLQCLFGLPTIGEHLTFKGGTSLSKGWRLIDRFSEDIDLVIGRGFLGFGGDNSPEQAKSKKQRTRLLKELKAASLAKITAEIEPLFREAVQNSLPAGSAWNVQMAPASEAPDQQTILFSYPTTFEHFGYIEPVVRIELGARSDVEPSESPLIQPYLAEALPGLLAAPSFTVRAVAPRRTFLEKACLLHEERFRPAEKPRPRPLARHYYDLWKLIANGVSEEAAGDPDLFERVVEHRQMFFPYSWVDYSTLTRNGLRLLPHQDHVSEWARDYDKMKGEMFFGTIPTFDEILESVLAFQHRFNRL